MTTDKIIRSNVTGLRIRSGSYYLMKSIKGERFRYAIGRTDLITKAEAEELAILAIKKAQHIGVRSFKALGVSARQLRLGSNSQTLNDVLVDFLDIMKRTGSKKTKGKPFRQAEIDNYNKEKKLRWAELLELPVATITEDHIQLWYERISKTKNKDGTFQRSASYYSLTRLNRLFNWALNQRRIEINPASFIAKSDNRVVPSKIKSKNEERLNINTTELGRFLFSLLHSRPKQDKRNGQTAIDVMIMALMTGARADEIFHMKWDWCSDTIDFKYILAPDEVKDGSRFQGTKTRTEYYYACSQIVQEMLKARYKDRKRLANELGGDAPLEYIFPNANGTGAIWNIRKRLKSICKFAGIDKTISMHDFRRTFTDVCGSTTKEGTIFPDRLIKIATQHKDSDITTGLYMGDSDKLQVHKIFQHVEEFYSQSIHTGVVYDIFFRPHTSTGIFGISIDNKTIEDGRTSSDDSLRIALYGDDTGATGGGNNLLVRIAKAEEIILREVFPKPFRKSWLKQTISFSNVMIDSDPRYSKLKPALADLLEKHIGGICMFRVNINFGMNIINMNLQDTIKNKFPDTYPDSS
jgi:site-specific recombinase XerD